MNDDELARAELCFRNGEFAEAIQLYHEARRIRNDPGFHAYIDLNVAQCLRMQGHSGEAFLSARHAYERIRGFKPSSLAGEILVTMGNTLGDQERHEEAIEHLREAGRLFSLLDNSEGEQQAKVSLARSLMAVGASSSAQNILEEILAVGPVGPVIETQVLTNLAAITWTTDPQRTETLLRRNLELALRYDDSRDRAITLINMALFKHEMQDTGEALIMLSSAESAAKNANASDLVERARRLQEALRDG